jgi:ATP-dependent Lon protease
MGAEATKLKRWVDGVLNLPFGKLERPIVTLGEGQDAVRKYLARAVKMLDDAVFGHDEPKERITQVLCQWISNPDSMSLVLGIQGPPGNGKTTLCRKGIAEALLRPFVQISLGGATDASVLEGHSYTYVGSNWGRIAGLLMETQCMNPVVFFDELDKVSETPRGEEINGVLTHLTDHSQNSQFTDRYFDGIPIDLSRAMFIFSFNDASKIHPVLRDRLTIVNTKGFNREQKQKIAQNYLLPELLKNVGMQPGDVVLGEGREGIADVSYLLDKWGAKHDDELGGCRPLKQALEALVLHINKLRVLQGYGTSPSKATTDEQPVESESQKATAGRSTESIRKATGHTDNVTEKGEDAADSNTVEEKEAADEKGEEKSEKRDSVEVKLSEHPIQITLPLKITREIIDKLLPEREASSAPAYMYV